MTERGQMVPIDGDLPLIHLGQHEQVKLLTVRDRTTAPALLSSPDQVLERVPYDHRFVWADAQMEHDVIARVQGGPSLNVYLAPFSMVVDDALDPNHATRAKATRYEAQKRNRRRVHRNGGHDQAG